MLQSTIFLICRKRTSKQVGYLDEVLPAMHAMPAGAGPLLGHGHRRRRLLYQRHRPGALVY